MKYPDELNAVLKQRVPAVKKIYSHEAEYFDLADSGAHVLYGDVLCPYIQLLFKDEKNNVDEIKKVFAFLQDKISQRL